MIVTVCACRWLQSDLLLMCVPVGGDSMHHPEVHCVSTVPERGCTGRLAAQTHHPHHVQQGSLATTRGHGTHLFPARLHQHQRSVLSDTAQVSGQNIIVSVT